MSVIALLAAWSVGCDSIDRSAAPRAHPPGPHADGERGRGWFMTDWGPEEVDYVWRDGRRVYEWDLVLDPGSELPDDTEGLVQAPLYSDHMPPWPADPATGVATIPYEIINSGGLAAATFDETESRILRAMRHWETYGTRPDGGALLRFVPHTDQARSVEFRVARFGAVCYKHGRVVDSDPACRWQTFVHEIGHVLSFRHEQRRPDRDGHVMYYRDRVLAGFTAEFATTTGDDQGTDYDPHSVMHYSSCTFSRLSPCRRGTPGAWVLENLDDPDGYLPPLSERTVAALLSATDICGLRTLYGASCTGSGADAGVPDDPDAGVRPSIDAGTWDAGAVDAGPPPEGVRFPVTLAAAGMIWSGASGETLCAAASGTDATVTLVPCDEAASTHRWGLSSTSAFRNVGSGRCAAPAGTAGGAAVEQLDCRPEDAQRWRFGEMELVNGLTGMCIAVPSSEYFAGQRLLYRPCNGAPNQRYSYIPETHALVAQGYCLTAGESDGARIELQDCDGSARQRWIESNGGFSAAGLCIHVRGGAMAGSAGAVIESAACGDAVGQMWGLRGQIAYDDDTYCMAAAGASLELAPCDAASPEQTLLWWPRGSCDALACADLGASCGRYDDGCGVQIDCGECPLVEFTGDAGPVPMQECIPAECVDLPGACGPTSDNCGGMIDCEPCPTRSGGCGCAVPRERDREVGWLAVLVAALLGMRRMRSRGR